MVEMPDYGAPWTQRRIRELQQVLGRTTWPFDGAATAVIDAQQASRQRDHVVVRQRCRRAWLNGIDRRVLRSSIKYRVGFGLRADDQNPGRACRQRQPVKQPQALRSRGIWRSRVHA